MTAAALVRREKWRNRAEAEEGFLKKAFFRAWDSRVLERYVSFGIKDVAGERGGVALKTRAKDEAVSSFPSGAVSSVAERVGT